MKTATTLFVIGIFALAILVSACSKATPPATNGNTAASGNAATATGNGNTSTLDAGADSQANAPSDPGTLDNTSVSTSVPQ